MSRFCLASVSVNEYEGRWVTYLHSELLVISAPAKTGRVKMSAHGGVVAAALRAARPISSDWLEFDESAGLTVIGAGKVEWSEALVAQLRLGADCEGDAQVEVVLPLDVVLNACCGGWIGGLVAL